MRQINRKGIIIKALLFLIVSASLMFLYEFLKQILFPQITIWASHAITITLVSIISSFLSYFYFLSSTLKDLYEKELTKRINYQNELTEFNKNLEKIIEERTDSLQKVIIELQNTKEKAEESNRLKTIFLHNMTHEIRTPLNAIMGFSDLLKSNFGNNEKLSIYSSIIQQRSSDLLDIIDEILEASKLEAGKMPVHLEEVNLYELIEELNLFFLNNRQRLNKTDIELKITYANCLEDTMIITDKTKLKQIFINLIHNAFKYTETGIIEIGCNKSEGNKLLFYVSDTGIGIEEKNLSLIFERFLQVENNNTLKHQGTGLGLSIVKGLVELLGGEIKVTSTFGRGSIFYFSIPNLVPLNNQ